MYLLIYCPTLFASVEPVEMRVNWVPRKPINFHRVEELLRESISSNTFTNYGPVVKRTEEFIRHRFGINENRAVILVSNATIALDIVARGFDLLTSKDNKWATSAFTFPSSAQVKGGRHTEIVDIDGDFGLDLTDPVLDIVDGLFVTNVFGNIVDVSKYEDYAMKNNKLLVFDSAATPFTFTNGDNSLNRGHGSVLSFHHTKCMGFSEGGALFTTRQLEPFCRKLINFGIDNSSFSPQWEPMGMNGKMSDISASFLLGYLEENLDTVASHHRAVYESFSEGIKRFGGKVKMFPNFSDATPVVPCLCVVFDKDTDHLVKMLANAGIYSRRYYNPLDPSRKRSVVLHERILCLPCHTDVSQCNIDAYVEIIGNFLDES